MSTTELTYLTRSEVAQRLRLTTKTLANWASAGKGPRCIRLDGGHVRYLREEVLAWEQRCQSNQGR
jgi:predicted DNA-binding transcriptional regulator AlpA